MPLDWFRSLRKNLGQKNCELSEENIRRICEVFLDFEETEQSKIFDNADFGYWKVIVERPLRIKGIDPDRVYKAAEIKRLKETGKPDPDAPPVISKDPHRREPHQIPCGGASSARSQVARQWLNMHPTPLFVTQSGYHLQRREESRHSFTERSCPMCLMLGIGPTR